VPVGIEAQVFSSVAIVAEFRGCMIKRCIVWYLELSVEKVSAVTAGCVDVWYDNCVLLDVSP
jgi:hypothetical protein